MERIHKAITARVEDRILNYIVRRLPSWVTPDILTFSALFASLASGVLYVFQNDLILLIISLLILYHWAADGLDGRVARFRNIQRPNYGYYIDHILDAVSTSLILGGIYFSNLITIKIAPFVLVLYLLLMAHTFLKEKVTGKFELSILKLGPTEGRLILVLMNIVLIIFGNFPTIFKLNFLDLLSLIAIVIMVFVLFVDLTKTAVLLEKQDRSI